MAALHWQLRVPMGAIYEPDRALTPALESTLLALMMAIAPTKLMGEESKFARTREQKQM